MPDAGTKGKGIAQGESSQHRPEGSGPPLTRKEVVTQINYDYYVKYRMKMTIINLGARPW